MKFTLSWLRDHLKLNKNINQISEKLTNIGLEVESVESLNENFQNFFICRILKCYKHPNADRLKVCEISYGEKTYKVVCGATNAVEGLKTVFAPNGSYIPGSNFKLEKKNIRGIEGDGMLCSEEELGLAKKNDGIIELGNDYEIGKRFISYIQEDFIFSIGLTPNRGDCASVRGIARDLAASLNLDLIKKKFNIKPGTFKSSIKWDLSSLKFKNDCPLIYGRQFIVKKNFPSPSWLKLRLESIGLKSISSLVDITNYILVDIGRPLHVFDVEKINGNLKVITLEEEEKFIGLDKKEYILCKGDVVIKDDEKTVSIAGIMGGLNSCVDVNTNNVFLEVAYFDSHKIAQTGRRLGITSDARYRFERGIDPNGLIEGLEYSTNLIIDICGGSYSDYTKSGTEINLQKKIKYDFRIFEKLVGFSINKNRQKDLLSKLNFVIEKEEKELLHIIVPSWRHDIKISNDIVEEILRLEGYENIPEKNIINNHRTKITLLSHNKKTEIRIRDSLAKLGLYQVLTFSFISENKIIPFTAVNKNLKLENPISSELNIMRNSLLPNLLDIASRNFSKGIDSTNIFELGSIYNGLEISDQKSNFAILISGNAFKKNWHFPRRTFDFYDMKSLLLALLNELDISDFRLERSKDEWFHPGISADLIINEKKCLSFGELHPNLKGLFKIKQPTIISEGSIEAICKVVDNKEKNSLNIYPLLSIKKDFAFIISSDISAEQLIEEIKKVDENIGEVNVFDVYKNENKSELSLGIEMEIIQKHKVLNSQEINSLMDEVIKKVEKNIGAKLRVS
ncbi:MAG: phenylalanine--tRNA ligase subunit beta [Rhodobacteraceae bacterium]|nr:phenylalanine--tRNA ligase subunit beta [Paracoccaceae bacterium]OUU62464.1 MAG: phenylalanine--tRNA ligase subunit beta [Alphaproteobacteria bacterium TMED62]|tara:strand:- start:4631 stop:7012 length:2382 start_codon:yes stop_codon:yes gene_type:complete